jgi:hypothetical protein
MALWFVQLSLPRAVRKPLSPRSAQPLLSVTHPYEHSRAGSRAAVAQDLLDNFREAQL